MDIRKQSLIFTLFLFIFYFILSYYSAYKPEADISILALVLNGVIDGVIMGVTGGMGFFLGQLKTKEPIAIKYLVFSALFVFLMAHNVNQMFGLYQVSWFAYPGVLFVWAFAVALKVSKLLKQKVIHS